MMTPEDRRELLIALLQDLGVQRGDKLAILRPVPNDSDKSLFEFIPDPDEGESFEPFDAQLHFVDLP